jgi:hypothetical protein
MITVATYLRTPNETFEPVETSTASPADPDYIEGAIELVVDGTTVIGTEEWDYVDQLWAYVADMVEDLRAGEDLAETYFPDQPIRLAFERTDGEVLITAELDEEVRHALVPEQELITALDAAARRFFEKMTHLAGANATSYKEILASIGA